MIKVKFIWSETRFVEEDVNKFLKQCDKEGFVVRNITYICVKETRYHVFVEYETMDVTEEN